MCVYGGAHPVPHGHISTVIHQVLNHFIVAPSTGKDKRSPSSLHQEGEEGELTLKVCKTKKAPLAVYNCIMKLRPLILWDSNLIKLSRYIMSFTVYVYILLSIIRTSHAVIN